MILRKEKDRRKKKVNTMLQIIDYGLNKSYWNATISRKIKNKNKASHKMWPKNSFHLNTEPFSEKRRKGEILVANFKWERRD